MRIDDAGSVEPTGALGSSLWDGMAGFANAAASGQVEINEEGGAALLAVLGRFKQEIIEQQDDLRQISVPPPLGRLKSGEVMAPFMVQVATDGSGFVTRLHELRDSLTKAEEGIKQAMANFQATEEANLASMNKFSGELA